MKSTWTIWLLGGALAASLHWNWRQARADSLGSLGARAPASGASTPSCTLALEELSLSDEQQRRLDGLCRASCEGASDDASRAEEKLAELRRMLSAERPDEARLAELVREVSTLRERSLGACVDSILEVRAILDAEQLAKLVATCCPAGTGAHAPASTE